MMYMLMRSHLLRSLLFACVCVGLIHAQTCQDSGQSDSSCECSPGLTNSPNCDILACGNPFITSSKRPALNTTATGNSGNDGCQNQCTDGFAGTTCNICQDSRACQSAFSSVSSGSSPSSGISSTAGLASTASEGLVCSTEIIGYGVNFAECTVDNPTIASFYPGRIWGTIQRNVDLSAAALPSSVLSTLSPATTLAQIWYSHNSSAIAQEQFFCQGFNCTQSISHNAAIYSCPRMKCRCLPGTPFCSSGGALPLESAVNSFTGHVSFECSPVNATRPIDVPPSIQSCNIKSDVLANIFGPNGLALSKCMSGECIQRAIAEAKRQSLFGKSQVHNQLSVGLILGIIVIIIVVLALLALVLFGFWQQRRARRPLPLLSSHESDGAARLIWHDLRYVLTPKRSRWGYRRARYDDSFTANRTIKKTSSLMNIGDSPMATLPSKPPAYNLYQPKHILRGLSGAVEPGTMMAILGPSGAGKSTFLDILAGQRKAGKITGSHFISLPGRKFTAASGLGINIGFVDQADIISPTSTVREALTFAAKLKLPECVSQQTRDSRVGEVIELLGLAHVANSKIGDNEVRGLSGGERRRVSIGLELISKPAILFLDEPTSGLDSVSAMKVVNVLKGLSTNASEGYGTTIVCSIHQPSSQIYYAFDSICLLAPGGRQVYCGKTENVNRFIASHGLQCPPGYNIADYLLEVASNPSADMLERTDSSEKDYEDSYPASIQSTPTGCFGMNRPRTTMMTQFQSLSQREWVHFKRDPTLFWMHAGVAVATGLFVGIMYFQVKLTIAGFQNRVGSMFFLGTIVSFSALSALNNFLRVRLLFMRERASNYYSPAAWLICRLFFDIIPLRIIPALLMSVIMYFMVGLDNRAANFLKFLLAILQLTIVQTLFNLLLAVLFAEGGQAILLASLTNLVQFAFAGFFVNLSTLSRAIKWIQYLTPFKFALEAIAVNEVGTGLMIVDNLEGINIQTSASLIMDTLFGFKPDAYWRDVMCLFLFMAGFTALLIASVYLKLKQTR